jgi:DNA-binding response OmpR family regulator
MLRAFGFCRISRYAAVEEAREALRKTSADLLVCNPFPDMGKTFGLLQQLRTPSAGEISLSPFIVTTANVNVDLVKEAKRCDVDCIVTKPFSPRTLLDRIVWSAQRENRRNPLSLPDTYVTTSVHDADVELW